MRLEPGMAVFVTGPSGCGKSSLLRAIAGARSPSHCAATVPAVRQFASACLSPTGYARHGVH